jgi:hypothetical protein
VKLLLLAMGAVAAVIAWLFWATERDLREVDGLPTVQWRLSNVRALTDSELDDWPDYFATRTTQSSDLPTEGMN